MDRGSVVSGKSSAKQVLKMMLSNMLKLSNQVMYEVDPKLWYFSAGGTTTTIKQIEALNHILDQVEK